jgi:hypothetical protein
MAISRRRRALELMQGVIDRGQRHALASQHRLFVQQLGRHVPVARAEQDRSQGNALPRRAQASTPKSPRSVRSLYAVLGSSHAVRCGALCCGRLARSDSTSEPESRLTTFIVADYISINSPGDCCNGALQGRQDRAPAGRTQAFGWRTGMLGNRQCCERGVSRGAYRCSRRGWDQENNGRAREEL